MSGVKDEQVNPAREASASEYEPTPVTRAEHAEGALTRLIEQQTARVPSDLFLAATLGAISASLYFYLRGNKPRSMLLGLWAPTLLTMGVYNKLVKLLKPR